MRLGLRGDGLLSPQLSSLALASSGDGRLGSGSGVGLVTSSSGQMVEANPLFTCTHSTKVAKSSRGPLPGRFALDCSLAEAGDVKNVWIVGQLGSQI